MSQNLDEKVIEADAIASLLIKKGVISVHEYVSEMEEVKHRYYVAGRIEGKTK